MVSDTYLKSHKSIFTVHVKNVYRHISVKNKSVESRDPSPK